MTPIHIACTSDDRYIAHTAAMLHSVRWHAPDADLRVHFLSGSEPSREVRMPLAAMARELGIEMNWVDVPETLMEGLSSRDYLSRVVWYRVFMPELLPELDRVLYLDSDVIAMASIGPLWATPLDNDYFAAVTNVVPKHFAQRATQLGLPGAREYFNLGVALWNLDIMRKEGFTAGVLRYARENLPKLLWLEQDAINVLHWRRRRVLHPRWNCQNGIYCRSWGTGLLDPGEMQEALEAPALLHFEGGSFAKPWHLLSTHPLRERYYFHRRHTPWSLVIPEGVTPRNLVKRYAPAPVLAWLRRVLR